MGSYQNQGRRSRDFAAECAESPEEQVEKRLNGVWSLFDDVSQSIELFEHLGKLPVDVGCIFTDGLPQTRARPNPSLGIVSEMRPVWAYARCEFVLPVRGAVWKSPKAFT